MHFANSDFAGDEPPRLTFAGARQRDSVLVIPTGDRRHMPWIREGRISFEVFARANRDFPRRAPDHEAADPLSTSASTGEA
jgi:hypothetical protein